MLGLALGLGSTKRSGSLFFSSNVSWCTRRVSSWILTFCRSLSVTSGRIQELVSLLINWFFEPSQPLGFITRLKETFIRRYIVERTNKAEIRPEEQNEKTESSRENLWNEIQLKGP